MWRRSDFISAAALSRGRWGCITTSGMSETSTNPVPAPPSLRIPFNRSSLVGREMQYIAEAMLIGQIGGDQTFTKKCQAMLESAVGAPKALLTTSCTHALEMAALLLDIKSGD